MTTAGRAVIPRPDRTAERMASRLALSNVIRQSRPALCKESSISFCQGHGPSKSMRGIGRDSSKSKPLPAAHSRGPTTSRLVFRSLGLNRQSPSRAFPPSIRHRAGLDRSRPLSIRGPNGRLKALHRNGQSNKGNICAHTYSHLSGRRLSSQPEKDLLVEFHHTMGIRREQLPRRVNFMPSLPRANSLWPTIFSSRNIC